jgi:2-polyprenyl-3-methyl-5-hydroxy-6-metoxy-1,4-benzoquinol methylase
MNTETLARTPVGKCSSEFSGPQWRAGRFFGPQHILQGVDGLQGRTVVEVGCGTGFFTIPAAQIIGEQGRLVAMDIHSFDHR